MKTKITTTVACLACLVIGIVSCYFFMSARLEKTTQQARREAYESIDEKYFWCCPDCGYYLDYDQRERYEGSDPSLDPPLDFEGNLGTRYRFVADFNGNGLEDMALSEEERSFGTGGGLFYLYMQTTNGVYRGVGEFGTKPHLGAIRIEHLMDENIARIWTRWRLGGGLYALGCQKIDCDGILSRDSGGVSCYGIWEEKFGTISERLFDAVFGHPHTVPIRLEYSNSTNALGEAVWVLLDSYTPPKDESENPPAAEEE